MAVTGSAAVNMCHAACGRVDAYWELLVGGPWDLAAGAVIVREAGGVVTNCGGDGFDVTALSILCGAPPVVAGLAPLLTSSIVSTYKSDPESFSACPDAVAAAAGARVALE